MLMNDQLLSFEEARQLLHTSESHLRSLVFKKKISFIKIGRLIRFSKNDLISWIESNKVKSSGGIK
jgi:excisionase family DNA binding protein